jgi:hypothetical protein
MASLGGFEPTTRCLESKWCASLSSSFGIKRLQSWSSKRELVKAVALCFTVLLPELILVGSSNNSLLSSVLSVRLAWDCARHIASLNRGAQKITVGDKRQDSSGEHSASLTTVDRAGFALTGLTRPSALVFCVV